MIALHRGICPKNGTGKVFKGKGGYPADVRPVTNFILYSKMVYSALLRGGKREIRTPGPRRVGSLAESWFKPLTHLTVYGRASQRIRACTLLISICYLLKYPKSLRCGCKSEQSFHVLRSLTFRISQAPPLKGLSVINSLTDNSDSRGVFTLTLSFSA